MANPLVKFFAQFARLTSDEEEILADVPLREKIVETDCDLACVGDRQYLCVLLIQGVACTYKSLEDGRRQILSFHVQGDLCDLPSLLLSKQDYSIGTLTPVRIASIPHATFSRWAAQYSGLQRAILRACQVEASISREWILNVGRRTAYQRTAHLLCELVTRLRGAGQANGTTLAWPLTQLELADALGITPVHVNRVLQDLRAQKLVELGGGILSVRNWHGLKQAGGFNPGYLHQLAA